MAVGWYSMLKLVPWADVIANAPQIAEAAKKLWGSVARKAPPEAGAPEAADAVAAPRSPADRLAELEMRLETTEAALVELHTQMVESTKLIDTLASQNALLISRVEANRVLVRWLVAAVAVLAASAIALWWGRA